VGGGGLKNFFLKHWKGVFPPPPLRKDLKRNGCFKKKLPKGVMGLWVLQSLKKNYTDTTGKFGYHRTAFPGSGAPF